MKIIFVCTGNTCRSPMAEYLMREYCKKYNLDVEVESRGLAWFPLDTWGPISDNSLAALKEVGIDASGHKSKSFIIKDLFDADLIVTMTGGHKNVLINHFNAGESVKTFDEATGVGDINDPYGCDLNCYRNCRDMIEKGIKVLVKQLAQQDNN